MLHISLLGRFCVRRDGEEVTGLEGRKTQELLCYLLLYRQRSHSRETLCELLWGNSRTTPANKAMRQTLWQVQSALDARKLPADQAPLLVEPEWVQWNPACEVWLDAAHFEQAYLRCRSVEGRNLSDEAARALRDTVHLYRGDLLEGCYAEWRLFERERFLQMLLAMLDRLVDYYESRGDYEAGLLYGAHALRYDRAREATHQRLMRLYYLAGDRTAALRQYERCVVALAEELDVGPSRATSALRDAIRDERPLVMAGVAAESRPGGAEVVMAQLWQAHSALTGALRQIEHDMAALQPPR